MVASATAKTTHGASTIRSVPVIRVTSKLPVRSGSVDPVLMRAR
jgi:hypothetical protein